MPITSLPYVVPTLATDCHFHIFGPRTRYPFCAGRAYDPAEASCADYRAMADRLGMHRMIIVQPSPYGTDNSCMLDSLSFMGRDRARGIAVIDNNCSDEQQIGRAQCRARVGQYVEVSVLAYAYKTRKNSPQK